MGDSWIKTISDQRESGGSPLVLIVTMDIDRKREFEATIAKTPIQHRHDCELFRFDGAIGLQKATCTEGELEDGNWDWEDIPHPDIIAGSKGQAPSIGNIEDAMKYFVKQVWKQAEVNVQPKAKKKGITLILNNLQENLKDDPSRNKNLVTLLYNIQEDITYEAALATVVLFLDRRFDISPVLWRRSITVEPPLPTLEERMELIKEKIAIFHGNLKKGTKLPIMNEDLEMLGTICGGLNMSETKQAVLAAMTKEFTKEGEGLPTMAEFKTKVLRKNDALRNIRLRVEHGFDAIGGLEAQKQFLRNYFIPPLLHPTNVLGAIPPKGILLYGPPGTGKTILADAVAHALNIPLIEFNPRSLLRPHVGETEALASETINLVEAAAPAVVFMDEVDASMPNRASFMSTDSGVTRGVLNTVLDWRGKESTKTILVAATNTIEQLDPAFIRAGRIDFVIPILYPDEITRAEIFKVHMNVRFKRPNDGLNFAELASMTNLWSGAEIALICNMAANRALRLDAKMTTMEHFKVEIGNIDMEDQMEKRAEEQRAMATDAHNWCRNKELLDAVFKPASAKRRYTEKDINQYG